jgi:two-component system NtrC family sensor kinase
MWTLGQQITLELNPDRVLHRFIEAVVDVAGADGGSLGLMNESGALGLLSDGGRLRVVVSTGQGAPLTGTTVPVAGSAMGRAVLTGKPWTHHDVGGEPGLVYPDSLRRAPDVGGLLVVPLHRRGERIGAVAVSSRKPRVFTPAEIARVEAMTDLLTVSLSNAELVENLRQAEWRFRTLFRAAPDVVLTLLQSGRVREANEAVREVTGLEPANIVGRVLSDIVLEDDRQALTDAIARAFDGTPARCEVRLPRENGPPHVVALAASRLPEADPPSVLVIGRDVTAEREMRARLVETERLAAVGELVAGVAHEVNNPLSSISAFAQLLLRDPSLVDAQRDSLEVIKAETARASQVVKDLLAFARRSEHRQEAIDLNVLIERTLRLRGFQLNAANVRVDLALASNLPSVLGDARQLQQVVLNLVANAVQAMMRTGGGVLRLVTRSLEGVVVLEVSDTGTGIPASARPHIFEPFFTTKREGEGTGLGLSVSYGIVTAHGGSIGIAETSERGTTMVVSLPAVSQPATRARVSAEYTAVTAPRSALAGLRLLVVDDEVSLRSGIEAYGKLRGFTVVIAGSGDEALALLETTSVDAVVCDLRMPGMDGTTFHEILRREKPALAARTVFMTGDVVGAAFRSGTLSRQPVVMKPFALERLEDVVVAVLRGEMMQPVAGSR